MLVSWIDAGSPRTALRRRLRGPRGATSLAAPVPVEPHGMRAGPRPIEAGADVPTCGRCRSGDLPPLPRLRRLAPRSGTRLVRRRLAARAAASRLGPDVALRARRAPTAAGVASALSSPGSGLVCMGLFSSLFVLTFVRDLGLLAVAALDPLRPGTLALGRWSSLRPAPSPSPPSSSPCGASSTRAAPRASSGSTSRSPACRRRSTVSRIAQISDVHVGPTIKRPYVEAIVDAVNRARVDVVAITGDLVDGSSASTSPTDVAPLAGLRSRERQPSSSPATASTLRGADAWVRELRRLGLSC